MGGIFNIIVGLLTIAAGLSGKFVLFGTGSSGWLVAVGTVVAGFGIYRQIRYRKNK